MLQCHNSSLSDSRPGKDWFGFCVEALVVSSLQNLAHCSFNTSLTFRTVNRTTADVYEGY